MSHTPRSAQHTRRVIGIIGTWLVLVSLVIPVLVGQDAAATAPPDDDSGAQQTPCDSGFRLDTETNECVPIELNPSELNPSQIDPPELDDPEPRCLAGMVVDPTTGQCVPEQPDDTQQGCGAGLMPDPNTGQCIPEQSSNDSSTCDPGMVFDPDTGNCVPEQPTNDPPECDEDVALDPNTGQCVSDQSPNCGPGMVFDPDNGACVPEQSTNDQPACDEDVDPDAGGCLPIDLPTDGPPVSLCRPGMEFEPRSATCVPAGDTSPCPTGTFFDPASGDCTSLVPTIVVPDCRAGMGFDPATGQCEWVNQIAITKFACPEGTAFDAPLETLREQCDTMDGVEFVKSATALDDPVMRTSDSNGDVTFSTFRGGYIGVRERIPEGYGQPIVFCWSPPATSGPDIRDASGPVNQSREGIGVVFPGDTFTMLECDWFNLLLEDRGVHQTLIKWNCPLGTSQDLSTPDDYWAVCGSTTGGEVFHGVFGGTPQSQTTIGGTIDWGEVETGPWEVTEEIPSGYGEPVVFCLYSLLPAGSGLSESPEKMTITGGAISGVYTDDHRGTHRVCHWFNIPIEPTAHRSLLPSSALAASLPGVSGGFRSGA